MYEKYKKYIKWTHKRNTTDQGGSTVKNARFQDANTYAQVLTRWKDGLERPRVRWKTSLKQLEAKCQAKSKEKKKKLRKVRIT
jgi:hypothetical protein